MRATILRWRAPPSAFVCTRSARRQAAEIGEKEKRPGQRNPLKTLVSAMEIQDNQSVFLGKIWPKPCLAWLDFEKFGDLFDNVKTPSASTARQGTSKGARRKCALPGGGASTQFPNPR
jgi:hypothetical protein